MKLEIYIVAYLRVRIKKLIELRHPLAIWLCLNVMSLLVLALLRNSSLFPAHSETEHLSQTVKADYHIAKPT